jgi:GT2 family glycosyltransferase/O-antigen ligase
MTARRFGALWLLVPSLVVLLMLPMQYSVTAISDYLTPAVVLGAVMLGVWLWLAVLPGSGLATGVQPIRIAALVLLWSAAASLVAMGLRPAPGVEQRAGLAGLLQLGAAAGFTLMAADAIERRRQVDILIDVLVAGMAVVGLIALLQFATGVDPFRYVQIPGLHVGADGATYVGDRSTLRRVGGTASHPIELAVMLCMAVPFALHRARRAVGRARWGWWLSVFLIAGAIPTSVSRTGVLCLVVVAVVVLPSWPWAERLSAVLMAGVGAVAVRIAAPGLVGTLVSLFTNLGNDPSISHRTSDYGALVPYMAGTLWLGRGFGTFIPSTYDFLIQGYPFVDNQYLKSLIENGVVGLAALLAFLLAGLGLAWQARRAARTAEDRDLCLALVAALAAAAVGFATFDALSFQIVRCLVFLLAGCAGAMWRLMLASQPARELAPRAPGAAVAAVMHESAPHLRAFVAALRDAQACLARRSLVFVDNASGDQSAALVRRLAPEATVVRLFENAGYAAGVNEAAAVAPPDLPLLVLNPDVRLMRGSLEPLLEALREPGVGIAVPRLLGPDGRLVHSLRREPTVLRALGEALLGGRAGRLAALGEVVAGDRRYRTGATVEWASGAALLVSRECLDAVGPWDESFFLYSEETDFAIRARTLGWRVRYVPEAVAVHTKPESAPNGRLWTIMTVNRVRLYARYHSPAATSLYAGAVALGEAIRAHVRRDDRHRQALRAICRDVDL